MITHMSPIVIAVDFDGTVVTHAFPEVGQDIGAAPVLKRLVQTGHKLILYTMRNNCRDNQGASDEVPEVHNGNHLDDAVAWFSANGIDLYAIQRNPAQDSWTTSPKCYAQLYIDDAALGAPLKRDEDLSDRPFIDWNAVEKILEMDGVLPPTDMFTEMIREDMSENGQPSPIEQTPADRE